MPTICTLCLIRANQSAPRIMIRVLIWNSSQGINYCSYWSELTYESSDQTKLPPKTSVHIVVFRYWNDILFEQYPLSHFVQWYKVFLSAMKRLNILAKILGISERLLFSMKIYLYQTARALFNQNAVQVTHFLLCCFVEYREFVPW